LSTAGRGPQTPDMPAFERGAKLPAPPAGGPAGGGRRWAALLIAGAAVLLIAVPAVAIEAIRSNDRAPAEAPSSPPPFETLPLPAHMKVAFTDHFQAAFGPWQFLFQYVNGYYYRGTFRIDDPGGYQRSTVVVHTLPQGTSLMSVQVKAVEANKTSLALSTLLIGCLTDPHTGDGYYFHIDPSEGFWNIARLQGGRWTVLNSHEPEPAIRTGPRPNEIRGVCDSSGHPTELYLFVNGTLVGTAGDDMSLGAPFTTMAMGEVGKNGIDARFDNAVIKVSP
jgi:hypothetical protein